MWKCSQSNFHFDVWWGGLGHKGRAYFHHRSRSPLKLYTREKRARTKIGSAFFLLRRARLLCVRYTLFFSIPPDDVIMKSFSFSFSTSWLMRSLRLWKFRFYAFVCGKVFPHSGDCGRFLIGRGWWRRGWHTQELFRLTTEQLERKMTKLTVLNRFFGTRNDFYFTLPQIAQIQMTARAGCCIIEHNIILRDFQLAGIVFVLCLLHRFHTAFHAPQLNYSINFPSALLALNFSFCLFLLLFFARKDVKIKDFD